MSKPHDLDYAEIDERDEISGDQQLVLIWCHTHREWEWHWVERAKLTEGRRAI